VSSRAQVEQTVNPLTPRPLAYTHLHSSTTPDYDSVECRPRGRVWVAAGDCATLAPLAAPLGMAP